MGPQPIVKVKVREDVIPPVMVRRCLILPLLADSVEGSLGDLLNSPQRFYKQKQRGELPRSSLGNVPTPTTGYTLHC